MSFVSIILSTLIPFIIRTLMRYQLGADYLGLNSLFLSIIGILNTAELGIGSVIVFFLYKPIAENDHQKIEAVLKELRKMYRIIGGVILSVGLLILPFLPNLIKTGNPTGDTIYFYYLCFLLADGLRYFLCPEFITLSNAYQRNDLISFISIISQLGSYVVQIIGVCVFHNYFIYTLSVLVETLIVAVMRYYEKNRYFPDIHPQGNLEKTEKMDIRKRILAMIGHQLDERIISSIDDIILSAWIGLTVVVVYDNYFYVTTAITMFLSILYSAPLGSIGNALATETKESNFNRFQNILFLNAFLVGWACCCMLCLYQNFMTLWMGDLRLGNDMVILFCLYFYLAQMRRTVQLFKNAAGMWYNDRFKPYIAIIVDLALDLILIPLIGYHGAILSSIICVGLVEIPWESYVLFRDYFNGGIKNYYRQLAVFSSINLLIIVVSYLLCDMLFATNTFISLLLRFLFCSAVSFGLYLLFYHRREEWRTWVSSIRRLLHH